MTMKTSNPSAEAPAGTSTPGGGALDSARKGARSFLPVLALVVLFAFFSIMRPDFLSVASFQNIMRQGAFLALLALAGTTAILTGAIDLSVAANATLGGILVADLTGSIGIWPAILAALAACSVVGLINALVVIWLRVPSFLVTLGMLSVLDGISNQISGGSPIEFSTGALNTLVNEQSIPGIPNAALIAVVVVVLMTVLVFLTRLGRYIMAVGGNERAALLAGIPINSVKISSFVLGGLIAAIAGVVFTGQALNGVPEGADPSLLASIAAIVVGGTALSGGVGGPHRTLLGALVIIVLSSGMDIMSINPYVESIVYGLVVIAAVAVTIDRRRYGAIR
jgi:ribose transport system permease protein